MFRRLRADKDGYITNKIINGSRVTDANVGQAGTLDLFKLANESASGSFTGSILEVSRILIHFNLDPLRALTGSILDFTDSSFKARIKMTDVFGGQTIPSNFSIIAYPLSKSFDEGNGFDIGLFRDIDSSNFVTASTNVTWSLPGANASGTLNSSNIDIIENGNIGSGVENLFVIQNFSDGTENLNLDVTKVVSATLAGAIPDYGYRISYSGTQETDGISRFVKRFTSRHANDPALRPSLEVFFDDSIQDDHKNFFFDLTGTLFLNNFHFGQPANIISNGQEITGTNSLILHLSSGSGSTFFEKFVTASQFSVGSNFQTGIYFAQFAIDTNETGSIRTQIELAQSATFREVWETTDGSQGFFTGSLVVKTVPRTAFDMVPSKYQVVIRNNSGKYQKTEKVRFHIFVQNPLESSRIAKLPFERKSLLLKNMYYQIRDSNSGKIQIPFETENNGTKCGVHDDGMHFDLYMDDLEVGRTYGIELRFTDLGVTTTLDLDNVGAVFTVIP